MSNPKEIAEGLRKTAAILRKEAEKIEQQKTVKCAQVLTAARGLLQLRRNLGGVR
jgi:hypothetical protein